MGFGEAFMKEFDYNRFGPEDELIFTFCFEEFYAYDDIRLSKWKGIKLRSPPYTDLKEGSFRVELSIKEITKDRVDLEFLLTNLEGSCTVLEQRVDILNFPKKKDK